MEKRWHKRRRRRKKNVSTDNELLISFLCDQPPSASPSDPQSFLPIHPSHPPYTALNPSYLTCLAQTSSSITLAHCIAPAMKKSAILGSLPPINGPSASFVLSMSLTFLKSGSSFAHAASSTCGSCSSCSSGCPSADSAPRRKYAAGGAERG